MPPLALIVTILTTAEQLLPALQGLGALLDKARAGTEFNDADLAKLSAIADAIDAQVLKAEG